MDETTNNSIITQPQLVQRFELAIENDELAHAYLLTGGQGSGKTQLAEWVAMRLFCLNVVDGQPDYSCEECVRIQGHNHPDVLELGAEGQSIKVDQIRYLKSEFSKSAVEGSQKVFIVKDADKMTVSAANSLLKFLEEPSGNILAFLLTTNKSAILPTIQSRTQIVEFPPLNKDDFLKLLQKNDVPTEVQTVAVSLTNSLDVVLELIKDNWLGEAQTAVSNWYQAVAKRNMKAFVLVQSQMIKLATNRANQQVILDLIMLIWRDTLLQKTDSGQQINFQIAEATITEATEQLSSTKITKCAEIALVTKRKLDQNINFQNIVESLTIEQINILNS